MKARLFALACFALFHACTTADQIVAATWNVGLFDRTVADLELNDFSAEIDADILVLNEIKKIDDIQTLRHALGRDGDAMFVGIGQVVAGGRRSAA